MCSSCYISIRKPDHFMPKKMPVWIPPPPKKEKPSKPKKERKREAWLDKQRRKAKAAETSQPPSHATWQIQPIETVNLNELKKCVTCKKDKPLATFMDGYQYDNCKKCRRKIRKARRKELRKQGKPIHTPTARVITFKKGQPKRSDRTGSGGTYKERNANLAEMGFGDYGEYLKSSLWKEVKKKAYALHGKACHCCLAGATQIHHDWYGLADLKGERLANLYPLCRDCHEEVEHDDRGFKITVFELVRKRFDKRR